MNVINLIFGILMYTEKFYVVKLTSTIHMVFIL